MNFTIDQIRRALRLEEFDGQAGQRKMMPRPRPGRPPSMPGRPRQGGVMAIAFEKGGQTHLVLTKRHDDLNSHAGQISFPGGRREEGETLEATALREAHEEVGVEPAALTILGELTSLYILPSDYEVHPFVAWHDGQPTFTRQADEVDEILEVPIAYLLDPANQYEDPWEIRGYQLIVPYYLVGQHKVWGATAMMLSEFLERLRMISSRNPSLR